ncbi:MAG: LysM peptidoglycan-binding domain-containing protein [Myxococcales bacterium]|nr:LysM peptidoglycan-binding domain-containing protein [Myxococcales bacterium]
MRAPALTLTCVLTCALAAPAGAFPHVVRTGETAASIAERVYGAVEAERVIVAANRLEGSGSGALVPGMLLEIPAVSYHQAAPGETWHSIAAELLGAGERGILLAQVNGAEPWLPPAAASEIVVPYNLRYVVSVGDTPDSLAYRFLGRRDRAWMVAVYNGLKDGRLHHGDVLLIPLVDLPLTASGKAEAATALGLVRSQAGGAARALQARADAEIPELVSDVRHGRYVEAVGRGAGLLAASGLAVPQLAAVHRALTEAYVALGAPGLAATACSEWRRVDPGATLDPVLVSPKIVEVCVGPAGMPPAVPAPSSAAGADAPGAGSAPGAASVAPRAAPGPRGRP